VIGNRDRPMLSPARAHVRNSCRNEKERVRARTGLSHALAFSPTAKGIPPIAKDFPLVAKEFPLSAKDSADGERISAGGERYSADSEKVFRR
jgi:hypothetical protein